MPADILGMEVLDEQAGGHLRFVKGPIFTQMLLADEINRTPPKTQAALLQAMQERSISIGGAEYNLPYPFVVFATQNPIENEGTYPLPEAQLDRFSLKVVMQYPSYEEELKIAVMNAPELKSENEPLDVDWQACSRYIDDMPVTDTVVEMAVKMVRGSRPEAEDADPMIQENVRWGAGPRASQALIRVAKVKAAMQGRATPTPEDMRSAALPVLRHRMMPTFSAEAKHITSEEIIAHLIKVVG
jgi:MoxR-like ATPase